MVLPKACTHKVMTMASYSLMLSTITGKRNLIASLINMFITSSIGQSSLHIIASIIIYDHMQYECKSLESDRLMTTIYSLYFASWLSTQPIALILYKCRMIQLTHLGTKKCPQRLLHPSTSFKLSSMLCRESNIMWKRRKSYKLTDMGVIKIG